MAGPLSETGSLPASSVSGAPGEASSTSAVSANFLPWELQLSQGRLRLEIWEVTAAHPLSGYPAQKGERLP